MYVVVDTNVLVVANGRDSPQASLTCIQNCARELQTIEQQGVIVIDTGWQILKEYIHNNSSSGQPGVGDAFLKWVLRNRLNPNCCQQVAITPIPAQGSFAEFPSDPALAGFDLSDRKFVAVAVVHPHKPPILNAEDRGWRIFYQPLVQCGVQVEFLCPEILAP